MDLIQRLTKHRAAFFTIVLAIVLAGMFAIIRIGGDPPADISRQTMVFNTYVRVKIWDAPSLAEADQAAEEVFAYLRQMEGTINVFDEDSELSRLNRQAYDEPFICSSELWDILRVSERYYRRTNGLFDVTIGSLMDVWGFYEERDIWPTDEELERALAPVGMEHVVFNPEDKSVKFKHPDTYIDLGGIAKGYALDRAGEILREHGMEFGMIDFGGDILCLAAPEGADGYQIGIQDPQKSRRMIDVLEVENRGVATSGSYENFRELDGRKMGHIFNPETGEPAVDVLSATVVAKTALEAEVYATALAIGGLEMARQYVQEDPEYRRVILILPDPEDDDDIIIKSLPEMEEVGSEQ